MMLFFDTYAIIELIKGNPCYAQFQPTTITTTVLNVAELYYYLLKEAGKNKADIIMQMIKPDIIEFDTALVKKAMEFRWNNIKKKFSMVDCIGYVLAQNKELIFLTGDDAFRDLSGVEFVK